MIPNEITKGGKDYVGYDYKTVVAPCDKVSMYLDAYENFGWIPDEAAPVKQFISSAALKLKRDRKISNKAELTRLQQHFEACLDEISSLEASRLKLATMFSLIIGIAGTAFLAGSVFAVTNEPPSIFLCVLFGIPGITGWAIPYSLYRRLANKRAEAVAPLIAQKYDEIHEICEKGNALVH